jgi:5'-nucleotidase
MDRPLRMREITLADGSPALTSDGAPSDCVSLALLGAISPKVDLVISGINPTGNMGHDVTYSGTVPAAIEAVIGGVMGVAVSLDAQRDSGPLKYEQAARAAAQVVSNVQQHGLPKGILLNVNVPDLGDQAPKGFLVTRQGLRVYNDSLISRLDPRGHPYYWIGGDYPTSVAEDGTDFGALAAGYISITPLHLDLTAHKLMNDLKQWEWPAT